MKQISIVGFGRFGKTLYRLLKDDFSLVLFNRSEIDTGGIEITKNTKITKNISEIYKSDVIFFAVPISSFDSVIKEHRKYFNAKNLLIDVLSVKIHPKRIFEKYLKGTKVKALLTHPMFGPDSSKNGFLNLPIVMDQHTSKSGDYAFWKKYFKSRGLKIVEISAKKHDQLAADSQAIAHFIGRGLKDVHFKKTSIDTKGAEMLSTLMDLTTRDSIDLFFDLQRYNEFTKVARLRLLKALTAVNKNITRP